MSSVSFHSNQTQDAETGLRSPTKMPVKLMKKQKEPGLPGNLDFFKPQEVPKDTITLPSALPHRLLLKPDLASRFGFLYHMQYDLPF